MQKNIIFDNYMDINYLIGMLIIVAFCLLGYTHFEHLSNEVIYVKSSIDNNEYLVRNLKDKDQAADVLAKLRMKLEKLCDIMKKKYPTDESVLRMNERFNSDNISESGKSNQYTSYSVNKGEKIVFCIRQKDEEESIVDENTLTFVSIHELAHIMTKSVGHTPEFWDNFKRLLKVSVENDLYKNEDYSKNPKEYCGIKVSDSPLN
jgi:predicted metal-dependent hydrolase